MLYPHKRLPVDAALGEVRDVVEEQFLARVAEELAGALVHRHVPAALVVDADRHVGRIDRLDQKAFEHETSSVKGGHDFTFSAADSPLARPEVGLQTAPEFVDEP